VEIKTRLELRREYILKFAQIYHQRREVWERDEGARRRRRSSVGYREIPELLGERVGPPELLLERLERLLAVLDLVRREHPGRRVRVRVERVEPRGAPRSRRQRLALRRRRGQRAAAALGGLDGRG
jgi:hypothetical protein